uniref:Cytochrome c biogenesis protein Ccs1 n=1 Tax=Gracilariopsis longissima TaxID=172976 RepID=A0A345U9A2_9FLOR|nr:Cytochrome c biogenesis protein [Gracilariopsis longissima]AXI97038.1 Cytochrome c biogenesis protein [Gracilariopsis longissima]UAD88954.1 Cytochrome c biogenesis protein [Gracilariopsis longissima]
MKNIIWYTIKKLSNLNLSIILLLIIASISIIGTIIEQNQSLLYYQNTYPVEFRLPYSIINWKIIILLGLDHIYSNICFIFLLTVFCCSLISCTFSYQLPGLKNARKWKFLQKTQNIHIKAHFLQIYKKSLSNIIYTLHNQNYYIFHKQNNIYAYKGLSGRIAPVFVHFSIILTLIGSITGLLGGFTAQEIVPVGEIFHIKNIIKSGFNSQIPNNLIGKVKKFNIKYHPNNSIKQFLSAIHLYSNQDQHLIQKNIFVNSPLIFKNITFYQTDWQINSIRLKIGNSKIIQKQLIKTQLNNKTLWSCQLPINNQRNIILIITKLNDKIAIYNTKGNLLISMNFNEPIIIDNISLKIIEIMTSTGLQMKTDPGIPIIYTGFMILMISIIISYISYSQIWINSTKEYIELAGFTNRATLSFEEDLINIEEMYSQYFLIDINK